jgi:sphingomyelin phosphodiesterase
LIADCIEEYPADEMAILDPDGQLAWLVDELQAAEDAGQRVYIIGHMPFGSSDALHDGSNYLNQIVNRYDATIAAMFFGWELILSYQTTPNGNANCSAHSHTHKDEFEISYSDYSSQSADTAVMMSYIIPSLTPTSGEPAFRVYSVDPETFGVLDVIEYYTSLESSTYQTDGPTWSEYYSAKAVYGPLVGVTDEYAELTPAFWHNITTVFESNDTAFQEYYARKSRGWDVSTCDSSCKTAEICQLRAAEAQYNCVTVTPGIDFKKAKRDVHAGHSGDSDCSGSKAKSILAAVAGQREELQNALQRRQEKEKRKLAA